MKFDQVYPLKLDHRQRADGGIDRLGDGRTDGRTEEVVSIQQGLSYCNRDVGQMDEWARPTYCVEKKCTQDFRRKP
jgi:hypothetical protein